MDQTVAAPGSLADPGALGSGPAAGSGPPAKLTVRVLLRWLRTMAGIVPFGVYVTLGLLLPMVAVAIGAFRDPNGGGFRSATSRPPHMASTCTDLSRASSCP